MPLKTSGKMRDIINKKRHNVKPDSVLREMKDKLKDKLLLGDHRIGRASDKAYSNYKKGIDKASDKAYSIHKKVKGKFMYHLRGGEYGARQDAKVKKYREDAIKRGEEWTKKIKK